MNVWNANPGRGVAWLSAVVVVMAVAGCNRAPSKDEHAAATQEHPAHPGERKENVDSAGLTLTIDEAERAGIKVEEARIQPLGETVSVTATIRPDPDRLAQIAPRVSGRVISAPARLGDRVAAGQTLASLDSVEVGEAHAAWAQAQAELRIAEADFRRAEALDADEIIPRKDFLRARADRDKGAAALRASADRLRLLGGSPGASGTNVSRFALTAPFAGTLIEKKAIVGTLSSPTEPLFTIADLSRVSIQADLPEADVAKVRLGASAQVSVPAYPGETFKGRVGYVGAALDKDTRTLAARIELANGDGRLKPEMFATVEIAVAGAKRQAIVLPEAAIVLMDGQPTVFVLAQGAYAMRQVEPGERMGGRVVVKSGLEAGDRVITAGTYALKARQQKSQLGHGH